MTVLDEDAAFPVLEATARRSGGPTEGARLGEGKGGEEEEKGGGEGGRAGVREGRTSSAFGSGFPVSEVRFCSGGAEGGGRWGGGGDGSLYRAVNNENFGVIFPRLGNARDSAECHRAARACCTSPSRCATGT